MRRRDRRGCVGEEDLLRYEREARAAGFRAVAGIDEAGRGPLAGPVVAAAVMIPEGCRIEGVFDSKALSGRARLRALSRIRERAVGIGIGVVEAEEIDRINILEATRKAMRLAVARLVSPPDFLLIDGTRAIGLSLPSRCIVGGDRKSLSIAAASIVAKVTRDEMMEAWHERFPHYNFRRNKGYGTLEHRRAIERWGPSPIHRKTFRGVREHLSPPLLP